MGILEIFLLAIGVVCLVYMFTLYLRHRDPQILLLFVLSSLFGLTMVATTEFEPLAEPIRALPKDSLAGLVRDGGPWLVVIVGLASLFALMVRAHLRAVVKGTAWTGNSLQHGKKRPPHRLRKPRPR